MVRINKQECLAVAEAGLLPPVLAQITTTGTDGRRISYTLHLRFQYSSAASTKPNPTPPILTPTLTPSSSLASLGSTASETSPTSTAATRDIVRQASTTPEASSFPPDDQEPLPFDAVCPGAPRVRCAPLFEDALTI